MKASSLPHSGATYPIQVDPASTVKPRMVLDRSLVNFGGHNTNGTSVTSTLPLLHDSGLGATPDGGLTKNGVGTLILGGSNGYAIGTTVNSGTLITNTNFSNGTVTNVSTTAVTGLSVTRRPMQRQPAHAGGGRRR